MWAGHLRATNWFTFEHPGLPQALGANCAGRTGRRQVVGGARFHLATDSGFSVSRFAPCRSSQNHIAPVVSDAEGRGPGDHERWVAPGGGLMADLDIASECPPRAARASGYRAI